MGQDGAHDNDDTQIMIIEVVTTDARAARRRNYDFDNRYSYM